MRKLAAIMFTDIAGYTALMSHDEEKALQLLQKNRALLKPIIEQFRGEWLKEIGDGTLSSFASAVDAVNCALEIQHILRQDPELSLRIGIHIGDVVFERGDVFGDGVNVASRIEPLAEPGCICVSEQVYDSIRNKPGIETTFLGEQQLKGIDHPIRVFTVSEQRGILKEPETVPAKPGRPRWMVWAATAAVAVALAVAVVIVVYLLRGPAQAGTISSLAVLPLDNLGGDPDEEYFVDGMHEAIISNLARLSALKVISRTSAMRYKDTDKLMPEIARELNVDALVEGSVLKAGNRVRITAQLIHGASDEHLWANDYEGDLTDILSLQKTIARAIAGEIGLALKPEEKARLEAIPSEVNPEAYDHYLKGWRFREQENPESIQRAIEHLEQAVALDPDFALAWANLGIVYGLAWDMGLIEWTMAVAKTRYVVEKALDLDPDLAQAHVNLGLLIYYVGMNSVTTAARWDEAGAAFQRGVELNPGLLDAHYEYGLFLSRSGRYDEAIPHFLKAQELSPLSRHAYFGLGWTYFAMGQFEKAYDYYRKAQDLEPSATFVGNWLARSRVNMLHQQGRYEELLAEGRASGDREAMMLAYRGLNEHTRAAALFDSLRAEYQQWRGNLVRLHAVFGDREGALTLLEEHFAELSLGRKRWFMANFHSRFGDLHGDPRYQALMAQTGLQY